MPCQYDDVRELFDDLAPVKIGSKWGYIDRSGKIVIQPQFEDAQKFLDGLAEVQIEGRSGVIDPSGSWVWKPTK